MLEESRLPYHWRTVEDGVLGRTGDLSQRPCGYGNDRSRTSIEIDKRSRRQVEYVVKIHVETNRQPELKSTPF